MRIGVGTHGYRAETLETLLARLRNRLKIASKDAAAMQVAGTVSPAEAIGERQEQLLAFYKVYEELVETLCDAAQYGPTPALEKSYAKSSAWVREHYGPVRRYVVAYLRYASEDAVASLEQKGVGVDAFEALVAAPNLSEFLRHDDGLMISRLTRTREALNLYAAHLRQLAQSS